MALYAASLADLGAARGATSTADRSPASSTPPEGRRSAGTALGGWACFADCDRYDELRIPFLKRAQIAAADLDRAGVARLA